MAEETFYYSDHSLLVCTNELFQSWSFVFIRSHSTFVEILKNQILKNKIIKTNALCENYPYYKKLYKKKRKNT